MRTVAPQDFSIGIQYFSCKDTSAIFAQPGDDERGTERLTQLSLNVLSVIVVVPYLCFYLYLFVSV